jgi:hypothetical protein
MGGQLILPRLEQMILYPGHDYYNPSECENDPKWINGDLTCQEYSLVNANCNDIGDDGTTAFKSCPISCNSCENNILTKQNYTKNKMLDRLPSPVMDGDINLASYGIIGEMGDDINNSYAGLFSNLEDKIDDLTVEIDDLKELSALSADLSCDCDDLELESNPYKPYECSTHIIGKDFVFDSVIGEDNRFYPIKCGDNILKVGSNDTGPQMFYDCVNSKIKIQKDGEYEDYNGTCFNSDGTYSGDNREDCGESKFFLRKLQNYSCDNGVITVNIDREDPLNPDSPPPQDPLSPQDP